MNPIINVQNLSKNFREVNAVDQLSFSVQKGEVYGFLGQNGAGKSTRQVIEEQADKWAFMFYNIGVRPNYNLSK